MMQSQILASLTGVHKRFGEVTALDGLDLEVRRGELLALLGPNGAGKTTAISLMLGLQRPDAGQTMLFGESPLRVEVRRGVGVMMQEAAQPAELKVRELVAQVSGYYPMPLGVNATIALAGIAAIADRPYGKLSGGQKRQAQFALAICGRPLVLFLDEPSANLDAAARQMLWAAMRQLVDHGTSIVLTTHYIEEAEALADRVVVLSQGRCIASGTVGEMRAVVQRRRIDCLSGVRIEDIRGWPEVSEATSEGGKVSLTTNNAESVLRRLLAADPGLSQLEVSRAGLSEAIASLTLEDKR
jgi:ABC-2 type transport system ATP-binding protein